MTTVPMPAGEPGPRGIIAILLKSAYYWGAGTGSGAAPVRPYTFKLWLQADYAF